ncbi:MAG: BlaI/MecI/CopY family transcriptional regulator [Flavobacteriales bacterium]|nr:BlaI/MecI/CopY family transcriptional regulator [Flavobacteriales bacterium]
MKSLNDSELQIMEYLWKLKKAFLKEIVDQFPDPKPAYTTISTLVKRMCDKEYIGFKKYGRDKHYFPILEKKNYFSSKLKTMVNDFFNNSNTQFASFFTKNSNMSLNELEELQKLINQEILKKKND